MKLSAPHRERPGGRFPNINSNAHIMIDLLAPNLAASCLHNTLLGLGSVMKKIYYDSRDDLSSSSSERSKCLSYMIRVEG